MCECDKEHTGNRQVVMRQPKLTNDRERERESAENIDEKAMGDGYGGNGCCKTDGNGAAVLNKS